MPLNKISIEQILSPKMPKFKRLKHNKKDDNIYKVDT